MRLENERCDNFTETSDKLANMNTVVLKDGRKIGYADYGDHSGHPIFYFHGFPGSRLEAEKFHDAAASIGGRIIGIDRPGMGLSTFDNQRTILSWANDIAVFADTIGVENFSIISHSGGSAFAAACAIALPNRINRIAIVSGWAPFDAPEARLALPRGQRVVNRAIKMFPWLASLMMRLTLMMLKKPNKMFEQMIKQLPEVDQLLFRNLDSRNSLINSTVEGFRSGVAGPSQEMRLLLNQWGFQLKEICCPIDIWHGKLDGQVPVAHGQYLAEQIPNAQLKIIENEGHHSLIRNQFQKIIQELR